MEKTMVRGLVGQLPARGGGRFLSCRHCNVDAIGRNQTAAAVRL